MGKPRLIIIIRHAQSEGNKNREIHQTVPDHRVKLTPEGWKQAEEAGRKLRALLHPTDTLHFFTSPYRRARETTEGILRTLTAPSPYPSSASPSSSKNAPPYPRTTTPSPFPRSTIKVHEEPRLREQDFGNFQPSSGAMAKMWQERADYGHFFYRIPNGESAADAYDRISGFNESLWRSWADEEGEGEGGGGGGAATVQVLVTHGLMTRVFLMKWYHFSVEYFEDLRNVEHCEFVVMKLEGEEGGKGRGKGKGKYRLQNQLRTWSGLRRERAEKEAREKYGGGGGGDEVGEGGSPQSPIPIRKRWGGCQDGNDEQEEEERSGVGFERRQQMRRRQNTADLFRDDEELVGHEKAGESSDEEEQLEADLRPGVEASSHKSPRDRIRFLRAGRDGGGSNSGAGSPDESEDEKNAEPKRGDAMAMALNGTLDGRPGSRDRVRADALGDQSDVEDEVEEERENGKGADEVEKLQWLEKSVDSSVR